MLFWILQISIYSFILIYLIHYLINFFKSTLTVPKIKDLVNSSNTKYENIYSIINSNNNSNLNNNNENVNYQNMKEILKSSLKNNNSNNINMKNELKHFLKSQLNKDKSDYNINNLDYKRVLPPCDDLKIDNNNPIQLNEISFEPNYQSEYSNNYSIYK